METQKDREELKALKTDKYNIKNIMGEKYISIHDLANMSHSNIIEMIHKEY